MLDMKVKSKVPDAFFILSFHCNSITEHTAFAMRSNEENIFVESVLHSPFVSRSSVRVVKCDRQYCRPLTLKPNDALKPPSSVAFTGLTTSTDVKQNDFKNAQ